MKLATITLALGLAATAARAEGPAAAGLRTLDRA
jgi:hypothetical protein